MRGKLAINAYIVAVHADVVKYTFDVRDWIVDYNNPQGSLNSVTPWDMPASVRRAAQLVNGQYPGPLIECNEDDTIEVTLVNNMLTDSTTIHWHGLHVPGTPWMDGPVGVTQAPILPGENYTYSFRASPPGTHYWHSHMDAMQAAKGIKGPIIVHAKNDPFKGMYDEDQLVVLSDEWREPDVCLKLEGAKKGNPVCAEIDRASINGKYGNGSTIYPFSLIEVEDGKCYRLRFINMGANAQNYITHIAGHNLTLLSLDSYDVTPIQISGFNIHIGERYDVILCADQEPGNYLMNYTYDLACPLMPGNYIPAGMAQVESCFYFSFIHYKSHDVIPHDTKGTGGGANPKNPVGPYFNLNEAGAWRLTSPLTSQPQPAKPDYRYVLNLGVSGPTTYTPGTFPLTTSRWYMSAPGTYKTWHAPSTPLLLTKGKCGAEKTPIINVPEDANVIEVVVNNLAPTAHVLHLHGMEFQVINYANFSWCNNQDPYDTGCFFMPYAVSKCPKEDIMRANPDDPKMDDGLWWGCQYNNVTDKPTENLQAPLRKDMISIWRRSWVVLRIRPTNPGFWLFHCHMDQHIPLGMITVFNVLESQQPPPPATVPTEGSCKPWSWN